MPKTLPPEFKRDVVTVARRGDLTQAEVAADSDSGVSVESVRRRCQRADVDDGIRDGLTTAEQNDPPEEQNRRLPIEGYAFVEFLSCPSAFPLLPLVSWFPRGSWPRLPCGDCSTGELQVSEPTELDVAARYRDHPDWEPEWISGHFSVQGECSNRDCRSIALIAGKMKADGDVDERGHWHGEYDTLYELRYCDPALRLLAVADGTPDDVKRAVESASKVIWMDPPSAANRLRAAAEHLLTDLGIAKRGTTHKRIERLKASRQDVATVLEAVKWIGNDGSHTAALQLKDVLEGAVLLERALTLVYDHSAAELDQLAREINAVGAADERRRHRRSQNLPARSCPGARRCGQCATVLATGSRPGGRCGSRRK